MLARMVAMSIVVGACHASSSPPQFGITSVTAVNSSTLDVVFNDVPDPTAAETATNYTIPGLTVKTASSAGDGTVTLVTAPAPGTTSARERRRRTGRQRMREHASGLPGRAAAGCRAHDCSEQRNEPMSRAVPCGHEALGILDRYLALAVA
jgi:hypothetical protein